MALGVSRGGMEGREERARREGEGGGGGG